VVADGGLEGFFDIVGVGGALSSVRLTELRRRGGTVHTLHTLGGEGARARASFGLRVLAPVSGSGVPGSELDGRISRRGGSGRRDDFFATPNLSNGMKEP